MGDGFGEVDLGLGALRVSLLVSLLLFKLISALEGSSSRGGSERSITRVNKRGEGGITQGRA